MPRAIEPSPKSPTQKPMPGDEDGFVTVENVPIFDEHETEEVDDAGKPRKIKYDRSTLEAIAEGMNAKIRDTGDYVMLTDGHTPDPDSKNSNFKPDVLGLAGPFTVGEIGRENPRACILARFRYFRDKADRAMRLPRRSVEIWKEDNLEDRTIDPIALLGAEAPRRSLGMVYEKYSRMQISQRSGRPVAVARYSAAIPGGANTFIPGHDKEKHAKESNMDVQELLLAFENSDMGQWIKKQMAQEAGQNKTVPDAAGAPPAAPPAAGPDPNMEAMKKYQAAADVDGASAHMQGMPPADQEKMRAHYEKSEDEQEKDFYGKVAAKYQAPCDTDNDADDKPMPDKYRKEASDLRVKYARKEAELQTTKQRLAELESEKNAAERKAIRAERYSKLTEFKQAGVLFDPDEEIDAVAEMTESQWEWHQGRIAKYQKAPMGMVVPTVKGNPRANDLQSRVDKCNKAEQLAKSKNIPFRQALAEIG